MANDLNKCCFIGRLARDPEMRDTQSGIVANFTLANGRKYKEQESTEWIRCVAFSKLAEIVQEYCHKGDQLYIEGRFQTHDYVDKEGIKRFSTEIIVNQMQMLGSKKDSGQQYPKQEEQMEPRQAEPQASEGVGYSDAIPF